MKTTVSSDQMHTVNWRVVGLIVNARRIMRGWSVEQMAEALAVSASTIRRLEGQRSCSAYTLCKVMLWTGESMEVFCWPDDTMAARRAA